MRKAIALAGILTFTAMPKVAISDHLAPKIKAAIQTKTPLPIPKY